MDPRGNRWAGIILISEADGPHQGLFYWKKDYEVCGMKIEIEIPKEFEEHFKQDRFEDALHRLSADAHLLAGNYEQETAMMLINAFKESKIRSEMEI